MTNDLGSGFSFVWFAWYRHQSGRCFVYRRRFVANADWRSAMMPISEGWPWLPNLCACDQEFVEWLGNTSQKIIFHMGPGLHHLVGRVGAKRNDVISYTISPEEVGAYIDLCVRDPNLSQHYKCEFSDIYLPNPNLLPLLDIVTLFHLGEMQDVRREKYAWSNGEVFNFFANQLKPFGSILFYTGSSAWDRIGPIVSSFSHDFDIEQIGQLKIFSKRF